MIKTAFKYFLGAAAFVVGFAAVAHASTGVDGGDSTAIGELLRALVDAFQTKNPTLIGVATIVLGVAAVKKWGGKRFPWIGKSPFPELMVLVTSFATTVGALVEAGSALGDAVTPAFKLAAAAAGGYAIVAAIGRAALDKWGAKLPGWIVTALNAVLWLFAKPGAAAVAKAAKAGDDAVKADPPAGVGPTDSIP